MLNSWSESTEVSKETITYKGMKVGKRPERLLSSFPLSLCDWAGPYCILPPHTFKLPAI